MKTKIHFLIIALFAIKMAFATPPLPPEGYRWVLIPYLSDEFNGTELNSEKWYDYHPWWKGRLPAKFIQETVSVKDGTMQIKNQMLDTPDGEFTIGGGAVVSRSMDNHFGYYECRFKSSFTTMSTTFWLNSYYSPGITETSCNGDNLTTEIDIVETVGAAEAWPQFRNEMGTNSHFHHWVCDGSYSNVYSKGAQTQLSSPCADEFHTYGAWWKDANYITPYADDISGETIEFRTDILSESFNQPLTMNMLTETYDWERAPTAAELANDNNNTSYYDWVRTYKLLPIDETLEIPEFNLLVNPDFEKGFLVGWAGWGGDPKEVVSNNQHSGNYAAHIVGGGAIEQAVGLKPNTNYILNCWAKAISGSIFLGIKDDGGSENVLDTVSVIDQSYKKYTLAFNSGDVYKGKIYFYAPDASTEGYVDDFELIEVGYVPLPADAPLMLYTENVDIESMPSQIDITQTISVPYIYKTNVDRELHINILNPSGGVIGSSVITAYAGYANYTSTLTLNSQPSSGFGYKIVTELRDGSTTLSSDSHTFTFLGGGNCSNNVSTAIEAENYDAMFGVQTEACSEGGENVGWIDTDDWMEYCIEIPTGGNYEVDLRLATAPGTGIVEIQIDGVAQTTVDVPATGAWQSWQTATSTEFNIAAGTHTIRLNANEGGFNINWLEVKPVDTPNVYALTINSGNGDGNYAEGTVVSIIADAAPTGQEFSQWTGDVSFVANIYNSSTAVTMPATDITISATYAPASACGNNIGLIIEAENYDAMSGVQTETCSEGGENVGWIDAGDWMEYCINIPSDGNYEVDLRLATAPGTGLIEIQMDGVAKTSVDVPHTGGWQSWETATSPSFNISSGTHTIKLHASIGGFNINWLEVKTVETAPSSNLVLNPGFETGELTSWSPWGGVSVISNNVYAGNHSVFINGSGAAEQYITVEPNTTYTLSAYGKVGAGGQQVDLGVKEYGGTEASVPITSTSYQQNSLTFTTGSSNTQAKIYYYCGNSTYQAYGDDFEVVAGTKSADSDIASPIAKKEVDVYPNPFSSELTINLYDNDYHTVLLIDMYGRTFISKTINEKVNSINLSEGDTELNQGVYFVRLIGVSGSKTIRVLKVK